MNLSIFEKNLTALQQRYPEYVEKCKLSSPQVDVQYYSTEMVSTWLKQTMSSPVEQVVLLGTRGGYAIDILRREYALRNLVVIEKDFDKFSQVLKNIDLTEAILDPSVFWVVGYEPADLELGLEYCKSSLAAIGFQLLQHPPSWKESSTYYAEVLRQLKKIIENENFNLQARIARGPVVQRNLIVNLPVILNSSTVDDVKGIFSNIPAIVVGAGPSLDQNVEQLKQAKNKAIIFCVDTALSTLNHHEIEPHFVVTSDPTQANTVHIQSTSWPDSSGFVFAPDAHHDVVGELNQVKPKICLFDNSTRLHYVFKQNHLISTLIDRPQHVGESAIQLAIQFACNPIILVGMDLAVSEKTQTSHASKSARVSQIKSRDNLRMKFITADGNHVSHNMVEVPGINEETVLTYYSFTIYLERLKEIIRRTAVKWIDCTEGGAKKEGCINQTLAETLHQLDDIPSQITGSFNKIPSTGYEKVKTILPYFEEGLEQLKEYAHRFDLMTQNEIELNSAIETWKFFLNDKMARTMLDHAAFQFQLHERVERLPDSQREHFLQIRAKEAKSVISMFIPIWQQTVNQLREVVK